MAARLLPKERRQFRLDRLGMTANDLALFNYWIREPHGIILITGPTGSGKSTTLYATLEEIKSGQPRLSQPWVGVRWSQNIDGKRPVVAATREMRINSLRPARGRSARERCKIQDAHEGFRIASQLRRGIKVGGAA